MKIAYNNVNAKVFDCTQEEKRIVSRALSYVVEGAKHSNAAKFGGWDGVASFYNTRTNSFPAGFVGMIKKTLQASGSDVQLVSTKPLEPYGDVNPVIPGFSTDPKFDYQMETVRRLVSRGKIIAQVATGGGKSLICQYAYLRIKRKTLFLTTRSVLMHQMKVQFEKIVRKQGIGVIGDGFYQLPKTHDGIVFTTVQSIAASLRDQAQRQITMNFLESFEFVILEEAHEASGAEFYNILNLCKNAYYRLALTATPFMRDNAEANMRLMAVAGDIGIRVSEKILIERGILARPYFKFIDTEKPKGLYKTTPWNRAYDIGIVDNHERNEAILREAKRAVANGLSILILIQRTRHGEILNEMLKAVGVKSRYIHGKHDNDERQKSLNKLANGEISVLIGSTLLDTGVDVPSIGLIILAGGGKAEVATRQRIGRGLRAKKTGPNVAFVVDFSDRHNSTLKEHSAQRRSIIERTNGFKEGILSIGEDFDFSGFN